MRIFNPITVNEADDALCAKLDDPTFAALAEEVLSDGTIADSGVVEFIRERKKPLREQRIVIGAVAQRARDRGIVRSVLV